MKNHVSELDSLRALAAIGVMFAHFRPLRGIPAIGLVESRLGAVGVDLFFALSGFLMTSILLGYKGQPVGNSLRRFFTNRFLRIFPLYYAAIAAFAYLPHIRHNLPWLLTFTENYGKVLTDVPFAPLNHFWTLAVEGQFYLAWPFIVLFCDRKTVLRVAYLGIAVGLASRLVLYPSGASVAAITQLTHCCVDPLAAGAVFAILRPSRLHPLVLLSAVAGVLLLLAPAGVYWVFARSFNSIAFAGMVAAVVNHSGAHSLRLLRLPVLVYLGVISYGLYVYHLPIQWLTGSNPIHATDGLRGINRIADFAALVLMTIAVSAVSWHWFESPINELKKRFHYTLPKSGNVNRIKNTPGSADVSSYPTSDTVRPETTADG